MRHLRYGLTTGALLSLLVTASGCYEPRPTIARRPGVYGEAEEYERLPYYRAPGYRPPVVGERELSERELGD